MAIRRRKRLLSYPTQKKDSCLTVEMNFHKGMVNCPTDCEKSRYYFKKEEK
jgi:hypothetical protein